MGLFESLETKNFMQVGAVDEVVFLGGSQKNTSDLCVLFEQVEDDFQLVEGALPKDVGVFGAGKPEPGNAVFI